MELGFNEAVLRLFLALVLGSVVGFEREYNRQSAGLRTHILVCLGSTVFTLVSISSMSSGLIVSDEGVFSALGEGGYRIVRDPGRIAAQIVTGIGFIGGGAVMRYGATIKGITTAASLWMMASVGMLIGTGSYGLSVVTTLFAFLVLFTIGALEHSIFKKHLKKFTRLRVKIETTPDNLSDVQDWMSNRFKDKVMELKSLMDNDKDKVVMTYTIDAKGLRVDLNDLSKRVAKLSGVTFSAVKMYHEETV